MFDFSRLVTPPEHGDVLIEPDHGRLRALAEANRRLIDSYPIRLLDRDLRDCRAEARGALCGACDGPVVTVGHQPEFIHAGVWAKHVVANDVAAAVGGNAVNLVVDSDVAKSTALDVPTMDGNRQSSPVPYAHVPAGTAYEFIPAMDVVRRREFAAAVREAMGSRFDGSCLPGFLSAMGDAADWVDQMTGARRTMERDFGVTMLDRRISAVWMGPLFGEMVANAEQFAACYNAALEEYRRANRVRGTQRPIPDLVFALNRVELPVWTYRPGGKRKRLWVKPWRGATVLFGGHEPIGEISDAAMASWDGVRHALDGMPGVLFRPRALALTLWARLVAGDLFVHGIGGAKYDRITDGIFRWYFNVVPPGMGCVSATMMLDGPTPRRDASVLAGHVHRSRDARFNPQRYVPPSDEGERLIAMRTAAVAESERWRRDARGDRGRRRDVFRRIRELNESIAGLNGSAVSDAVEAVSRERELLHSAATARRRDYFFAMMRRSDLQRLRETLAP
ncbi:MAG: hypothetical protein HOP29_02560 [Phycisphaerales bacterium]|nr:hypothetical protein [Phycisphaerales bacterium]